MTGLVLELQAEALNRDTPVSDLLRKALVVSRKLGVQEVDEWLSHELRGYAVDAGVPPYREVHGQIKVWNPYHGWQPLHFGDANIGQKLSARKITQPIGELESLNTGSGGLHMPFPERVKNQLMGGMEVPLEPTLHIPASEVVGILDAARNTVLDWALELERSGVLGDGLTFTNQEKTAANQITYQITNNIGSMSHSQLQQSSPSGSQSISITNNLSELSNLVHDIKKKVEELDLPARQVAQLTAEIDTVLSQSVAPEPRASTIEECLVSIRTILEGVASNVLASGFLSALSRFI